jgi:hypothetical protein
MTEPYLGVFPSRKLQLTEGLSTMLNCHGKPVSNLHGDSSSSKHC